MYVHLNKPYKLNKYAQNICNFTCYQIFGITGKTAGAESIFFNFPIKLFYSYEEFQGKNGQTKKHGYR